MSRVIESCGSIRRRAATASEENGTKSASGNTAKKMKTDGGSAEDKEVSWFSYHTSSSYLKNNIESCSKPTAQISNDGWSILSRASDSKSKLESI